MTNYDLLNKPLWSLNDIKSFANCSNTKASQIMQEAKKISMSRLLPSKAKRDNILKVLNIDFKEEIQKQKLLYKEDTQND